MVRKEKFLNVGAIKVDTTQLQGIVEIDTDGQLTLTITDTDTDQKVVIGLADPVNVLITDPVDDATAAVNMVDFAHHEIHEGCSFFYCDPITLASAATQVYLITTPDTTKWAHMIYSIAYSAITQVDIYEASDKTGTTLQTVFNRNRNSATAATTTIHKAVSGGSTDGTLICSVKGGTATGGSGNRSGGEVRAVNELLLKQNTKYLIRITSSTASNLITFKANWYEHTDIA